MRERVSDFWYNYGNFIMAVLVVLFILVAFGFLMTGLSKMQCEAQTQNIGFEHRWSFLGTCQIEVTDGKWIPLENYYFKQE